MERTINRKIPTVMANIIYKDMKIVINGKNNKQKDTYCNKANIIYLTYNKISNIIYMLNYNLLLAPSCLCCFPAYKVFTFLFFLKYILQL